MSWDGEADELYPHVIELVPPALKNEYGRTGVDEPSKVERKAHVEWKMRQVRNVQGELTMSSTAVYVNGRCGVDGLTANWKCTLPDGSSRPILSVNRFADEDGDLHEVLYLQ